MQVPEIEIFLMTLFYLNSKTLAKKTENFQFDVFCVSETWLNVADLLRINIDGYLFLYSENKKNTWRCSHIFEK